jgi:ribose transport system ATP-binding protein
MTDDFALEVTGVAKRYGAVTALRDASLAVRPGEVHALMGANGAGKSTLVKILNGAIRPDAGTFRVLGETRSGFSPAESRRMGIASVYQEPSLIADLDVRSNLILTATPSGPFRSWMAELGLPDVNLGSLIRDIPLPALRIIDLARALAAEPAILILDEMTAALPADLTERVMDVVRRQRTTGRSVVFISHRLVEIRALCDRATVLRDGRTVGVLDVTEGADERIVELMLGQVAKEPAPAAAIPGAAAARPEGELPVRLAVRSLAAGNKLGDVSFDLHPGEVLGVVALEGQGQDELFEVLSGSRRPSAGEIEVDGRRVAFGHPRDAISAGLLYVPANRAEALLMQRSVRENIALPSVAPVRRWGPIPMGEERARVDRGVQRLQIDTRAASEVRRLSGGNQQKVTIARWIAAGVQTLLCFDPTRGIDIRTKREIYLLLRELAAAGAAVLLYTSELEEIQLACDRAIVIFGGRVVDELPGVEADEAALLRAAHGLQPGFIAGVEASGVARVAAGGVTGSSTGPHGEAAS